MRAWLLALGLSLLFIAPVSFGAVLVPAVQPAEIDLTNDAQVLQQQPSITLDKILAEPNLPWQSNHPALSTFSINPLNIWVKIELINDSHVALDRVLHVSSEAKGHVDAYLFSQGEIKEQWQIGSDTNYANRPIKHPSSLLPIHLQPQQSYTLYMKVNTRGLVELPLKLMTNEQTLENISTNDMVQWIFVGGLLALVIFSIFMTVSTRSYAYGYFAAQNFFLATILISTYGYGFKLLWPNQLWFQTNSFSLLLPIFLGFSTLFAEKVLQLRRVSPSQLYITRSLVLLLVGFMLINANVSLAQQIINELFIYALFFLTMLYLGFSQHLNGNQYGKPYLLSWVLVIFGIGLSLTQIPFGSITLLGSIPMVMGLIGQVIIQTALLAERYHNERLDKQLAQQRLLEQEAQKRRTQENQLKAQMQAKADLERQVQLRTLELEEAMKELNLANKQLQRQSVIDALTHLKNRKAFEAHLQQQARISRRNQQPLAVVMLDIDYFKQVNDKLGHLAGDQALIQVANVLDSSLKRPSDMASRYGGEEFALILPNTPLQGAKQVAESIRKSIESLPIIWDGHRIELTISIGLTSAIVSDDLPSKQLLKLADQALYQAKDAGRNRVIVNTSEFNHEPQT
ncbi:sensor domain-containing diguanylate cyclase [Paraferrimonas haliotis]|uniref:sensor domain-containing diguanylate cyclase n=1 Tax=Paraferrimonas haliotis TaxID=2013866 RepID=UPI000BA97089|nr:diguanylate cyclase [Paraferrimonas haliotis]